MDARLLAQIKLLNPWLEGSEHPIIELDDYKQRLQMPQLLSPAWDKLWLVLTGPRRAGKTVLGKYLCHRLNQQTRYENVIYLNCDYLAIRRFLTTPLFIQALMQQFHLKRFILFIDEVQRLENPGLLLKSIADLALPIKMIASGSSQLEIRSKVQEHLTGRQLAALILPLSLLELDPQRIDQQQLIYGSYPQVIASNEKAMQLAQLYEDYISKDIVEILKVGKPNILQKLLTLLAHSSGQLVNYSQLASDCQISSHTIKQYIAILNKTYVIAEITPFVGNKRTEVTSNSVIYFIDNGFRNYALANFSNLESRADKGLLVESFVFQEILKYKTQHFFHFSIHYWRTKSGAKVDFVLYRNLEIFIPVEVKYQNFTQPKISRSFRSFIQAYQPKLGIIINKNRKDEIMVDDCQVKFIPLRSLVDLFTLLDPLVF